jgi:2-polyprenyl-3-methyl-5-hydroxy-6-metoxy-1,4-benzoquinol methylase
MKSTKHINIDSCPTQSPNALPDLTHNASVCGICRNTQLLPVFSDTLPWLMKCSRCMVQCVHPQPSDSELKSIYSSQYYETFGYEHGNGDSYRAMKNAQCQLILNMIEQHISGGRLLDVGSALGDMLAAAAARGWSAIGVERNEYAVKIAENVAPGATYCGCLEGCYEHIGNVDVITCLDVFEHLRSPGDILAKFRDILKPGGLCVMTTVDAGSMYAKILRMRWPHYHRDHLWYFTRSTMQILMREAGLELLACSSGKKVFSLQYIMGILAASERNPWLRSLSRVGLTRLPRVLQSQTFRLSEGMYVVARRPFE